MTLPLIAEDLIEEQEEIKPLNAVDILLAVISFVLIWSLHQLSLLLVKIDFAKIVTELCLLYRVSLTRPVGES